VRLPRGVFAPYTAIKTNILFFTKGRPTREVWFYEHPYPRGYKSYSKTRPMMIEEFEPERQWWTDRKPTDRAWKVSADEIAARDFNLDIPNPHAAAGDPEDTAGLLAEYEAALKQLADAERALREALAERLVGA
jgi:type I restriction enzyme M protein